VTRAEALEKSIAKWESIAAGIGADMGMDNCCLCQEFCTPREVFMYPCDACPVYMVTGELYCGGTPYYRWAVHQDYCHNNQPGFPGFQPLCPECRQIAQEEVDFLKSLREEA
jgi:hypothetical protein